jgi:hypothetical protein
LHPRMLAASFRSCNCDLPRGPLEKIRSRLWLDPTDAVTGWLKCEVNPGSGSGAVERQYFRLEHCDRPDGKL